MIGVDLQTTATHPTAGPRSERTCGAVLSFVDFDGAGGGQ